MVSGILFELFFAALLVTAANCTVQPSSKDVDITSLNEHLRKMDAVLQEVQSHSKAQEEESRAILTRVVSHLTQTTLELNISRSITTDLQLNYTTAMRKLAELEQSQNNTLLDYTTAIQKLSKLEQSHNNTIKELAELKQSHNRTVQDYATIMKKFSRLEQSHNHSIFELDSVKKNEISIQEEIKNINGTLSKSDPMVNGLSQLTSRQFEVLVSLTETAEKMNATGYIQLAGSDRPWSRPQIGFEAYLQRAQNVPASTPFVFNEVTYNEGNGYNKSTGYFTVPVSGTYLFWTSVVYRNMHITQPYGFYISSAGIILGRGYGNSNENFGTASFTTVFYLKKGRRIRLSSSRDVELNSKLSTLGAVLIKKSY